MKVDTFQKIGLKTGSTYLETIIKQANLIYDRHKKLIITVSGGIDSQTVAYAFKKANIPVTYIFADFKLNSLSNSLEKTFALQFAKDNDIVLEIVEINYSDDDIEELMFETGYFDGIRTGIGSTFQFDFMRRLISMYPEHRIVTGAGGFKFVRTDNTCTGNMVDLFNGVNMFCLNDDKDSRQKIKERSTSFIYYSSLIVDYYKKCHMTNRMLQFPREYQPKHLAHTELHFPMRYKLTSAEHMNTQFDYKQITKLNFGKDWKIQMDEVGPNNKLFEKRYSVGVVQKLKKIPHVGEKYFEVYRFETDIV